MHFCRINWSCWRSTLLGIISLTSHAWSGSFTTTVSICDTWSWSHLHCRLLRSWLRRISGCRLILLSLGCRCLGFLLSCSHGLTGLWRGCLWVCLFDWVGGLLRLMLLVLVSWGGWITRCGLTLFIVHFIGLSFLGLLLVFLSFTLALRLHNVVHQVINILIVDLLVSVVKLLLILSLISRSSILLSSSSTCLIRSLALRRSGLIESVVANTISSLALAFAIWLSLVVRKLITIMEDSIARYMLISTLIRGLRTLCTLLMLGRVMRVATGAILLLIDQIILFVLRCKLSLCILV